ncbi:MAG: diaminopimelate epimerase [Elusimicrobiaceae bacterium]|nr:diaminopimelate epimerase [Elusimicrobiaceae bacterium]
MLFTKYTGLGNDFVFLDGQTALSVKDPAQLAVQICNRRFGVGADGLVLLLPSKTADVRMRIFNADGSEAEMCGNASRCVPLHLYRRGVCANTAISLETLAGTIRTEIIDEPRGLVRVNMGPVQEQKKGISLQACGQNFTGTVISMGNPHFVIFTQDITQVPLETWGPALERHPFFPHKTNVEFVQVLNEHTLRMRVWERGAGITQACGTGACATAAAGVINGCSAPDVTVKLDGGELRISWPHQQAVWMTGPAREVFRGEIDL